MQLFKNVLLIVASVLLPCAHLIADELPGELPFRSVDSTASRDLDDKLIKAIINGNAKAVKVLIDAGANVNAEIGGDVEWLYAKDKYKTVLMLAAERGNVDIVKALIDAGANVNSVFGGGGNTALTWAAIQDNADIVKVLINAGANVNATDVAERTALMRAASGRRGMIDQDTTINAVRALIAAGANVNATDLVGGTALMEAARNNNVNTLRALIVAGADANVKDYQGRTACEWAELCGAVEAFRILRGLSIPSSRVPE